MTNVNAFIDGTRDLANLGVKRPRISVGKLNRELLRTHTVVRHQRAGNEQVWSVTGGNLHKGQIVHTHAMCSEVTAIKRAIRQDIDEANAAWVKGNPDTQHWPNNQNTGGAENERG